MLLSYCLLYFSISSVTPLSLPSTMFPSDTSLYPPCSPCSLLSNVYIPVLLSFLLVPGSWEDDLRQSRIKILLLDCFYKFDYHHHAVLLLMDLKVKAKQYILCVQYFVLGKRSRLKICVILGLNLINLRGTVPNTPAYSHALFRAWEYSLLISILLLLPHILAPYRSQYPLYSLVSSLDSHINYPRALLHIPSAPLYRLCTPIYPRTLLHIPSTPLYRLCTPIYSRTLLHIPSTPLYRLCSPIYPRTPLHIPSTPLYRLCTPIHSRTLLHLPSTPLYRLSTPIYPRALLHIPSTPLNRLCNPIYPRTLLHIPSTPLYRLCYPIYLRTLLHIPSTPLYRLCNPIYPRALLHIPSTPLYCLSTPIYPRALLHIPSTPLNRLCNPIYPRTLLHIPSTPLYRPCTLIYPYVFLHIPLLPFFSLLIIPLMNLQDNGLGSSLVKSRSKRSYHHSHSKKLSIKDLALELAKKHVSSIILKT